MVASILPTFMTLGLETSMNRFYFDFLKYPKIENVFVSTLIISISCFAILLGIIFLGVGPQLFIISFKSHRFSFFPFGISALLNAIPAGLYSLYLNYLRCRKDIRNYAILNLGLFILTSLGEIVGIVFLKLHVEQLIWIRPAITWGVVIVSTNLILWKTGVHFEKRLLRIALKYSTPLLPHLIFGLAFIYADRIMIENNLNLTYLAIYNLTMALSNIIDIFEQALRNATFPNIYRLLKENIYTNIEAIGRIHTVNGVSLMIIMAGVSLMTPVAVFYFLKPIYQPLVYLVPFALIISAIRFYYNVYAEPLFFFKRVSYISTATFLQGTFAILLNFILIPRFGLMGALLANITSKFIQVCFIYFITLTIKAFRYKLAFILASMFTMIIIFIVVSFSSRVLMDIRVLTHLISCIPFLFVGCILLYAIRQNKITTTLG